MDSLLVGTEGGLVACERDGGGWRAARRALDGARVTGLCASGGRILAGTADGVFRSDDGGATWAEASAGLSERYVRQIAFHPQDADLALAGTEPAAIFVSRDGGSSWRGSGEVAQLRATHGWFLPYSPGAGCVRAFAFHDDRVYAAVEIGGLLRSEDRGETWRLVEGCDGRPDFNAPVARTQLHPDVHDVAVIPAMPDVVYAATMRGLYRSLDGGRKWVHIYADCYVRAVWIDPTDYHRLVLGPADDVSVNGQVEESRDDAWSWTPASTGLAAPWRRSIVERFVQAGDELLAISSDGRLFGAPLETLHWRPLLADEAPVRAAVWLQNDRIGHAR